MRLPTTPSMATLHRSIVNVSTVLAQTAVGGRERSQSSALICTTASTKVKFQGGPAVHPGSRRRLLWVESGGERLLSAPSPYGCLCRNFLLTN